MMHLHKPEAWNKHKVNPLPMTIVPLQPYHTKMNHRLPPPTETKVTVLTIAEHFHQIRHQNQKNFVIFVAMSGTLDPIVQPEILNAETAKREDIWQKFADLTQQILWEQLVPVIRTSPDQATGAFLTLLIVLMELQT